MSKHIGIIAILVIFPFCSIYADSYGNTQYNFSFTIPYRWVEIPKTRIDERMRQVASATRTNFINYIAGFQDSGVEEFGYPNMLLQYHDLRGHNITWNDFVENMGNIDLDSYISDTGYEDFLGDFNLATPLIDSTKNMIIHNAETDVVGVGVLRSIVVLYLGKNGILQINITVPRNVYNRYSQDIITIIESLSFDYGYRFIDSISEGNNTQQSNDSINTPPDTVNRAIQRGRTGFFSGIGYAFIFSIFFGGIAFIKYIVKKNRKDNNNND